MSHNFKSHITLLKLENLSQEEGIAVDWYFEKYEQNLPSFVCLFKKNYRIGYIFSKLILQYFILK